LRRKGEIVGAVDFGSREIRVLIARKDLDGAIQIIGHGAEPSRGCISQGVIQDCGAAQVVFKKALASAEKEARVRVNSLFCAVNGKNVESFIREGNIKLEGGIAEPEDMSEALGIASHDILAAGKRVTSSVTSQEWYVDDLRVMDPIGIRGQVLKTRVHFARIPTVIEDNLVICIESQGRTLEDFIFTPLASAQGCLTPEEMELGVAVLDMGRSTTGIAVYRDYRILATHCFDWGGYYLTRDVAACLHVSFEEADELILAYGISKDLIENEEEAGETHEDGGAPIKLKTAVHGAPSIVNRNHVEAVIYERAEELLRRVSQYLDARNLDRYLVCGIVFTGGASLIKNHVELTQSIFEICCRAGLPDSVEILPHAVRSPEYSTVVGVVRHALEYRAASRSGRITGNGAVNSFTRRLWQAAKKYYF